MQDYAKGGNGLEMVSILDLILAALRKKLDLFRWTGWGVGYPVTEQPQESAGMKRVRFRS